MHERFDARMQGFVSAGRLCSRCRCALLRMAAGAIVLVSVLAAGGRADTIVLKNGKRIVALSVVEDGDKIRYETAAGQLTLPRSIVEPLCQSSA